MPEKISYTVNVQVTKGPNLSVSKEIEVEAYDKIDITIKKQSPAAAAPKEINLLPSVPGKIRFLLILADDYGVQNDQKKLSYKVNDATSTEVRLDAPQLFIGQGTVKLGTAEPTKLLFSNTLEKDVSVQILVGRDV